MGLNPLDNGGINSLNFKENFISLDIKFYTLKFISEH